MHTGTERLRANMNLGKDSFLISYSHKHIHINLHPQWLSSVPHHRNPHTNLSFFFVSDMMLWNTFKCLRRFSKSLFLHPVVKFVICRQQLLNTIQSFGYLLNDTEDGEFMVLWFFYAVLYSRNQLFINTFPPLWETLSSFSLLLHSTMFSVGLCHSDLKPS